MIRPLLVSKTDYAEYLVQLDAELVEKIPPSTRWVHACKETYLLADDNKTLLDFFLKYGLQPIPCRFPKDVWQVEYRYLGDFPVQQSIDLNLLLKSEPKDCHYSIIGELPPGIQFSNGKLFGSCSEPTKVIKFKVLAEGSKESFQTDYFIRFFLQKNSSLSFVENNFIQLGYGPTMVDYDPNSTYYRVLNLPVENLTLSPIQAAILAAKQIQISANGKTIFLYVSGGVDSQAMIQSFLKAKVPFVPVLFVDPNGSNADDVYYARLFARKMNLALHEYVFDYGQFIQSYSYVEMAKKYRFNNPEYGILLMLMQIFDGYGVYAGRPISISKSSEGEQVLGLAVDETWSRARYLEREGKVGCPEFLVCTTQMVHSFINTKFARNYPKSSDWSYDSKIQLLRDGGFDIEMAPPLKFTGFENLYRSFSETALGNELWLHHRAPLKLRFPNSKFRNALVVKDGALDLTKEVIKTYEDGFSYKYLQRNQITAFH